MIVYERSQYDRRILKENGEERYRRRTGKEAIERALNIYKERQVKRKMKNER